MSILNDKLEKIIADSGIYFYNDEIENELNLSDKIIEIPEAAQKMWDSLPCDANIAIYGLGRDSKCLFESVDLTKKNVVCMIDNNPEVNIFMGYPVIRSEDIAKNKIDIVIITSGLYVDEMKLTVKTVSPDCKIIYMWDEIFASNYIYHKDITWLYPKEMLYKRLLLNAVILSYSENHDFRYLLCIIGLYLEFRDLKNALAFVERYLGSGHPNMDKIVDLKSRLLNLLGEIKQKLETKQNPHTLVLIADCMQAEDVTPELTPFLHALGKSNIYCPNAHSHMGWTSTSVLTIFKQKSYIDNHLYEDVKLTGTEPFFKHLAKNNIDFAYYCPCAKGLFDNISGVYKRSRNGCADMMWQYLCSAFEDDKKALYFLHFAETHSPCLCLYHINKVYFFNDNNYFDCVKYLDSQTEFLFELLPNSTKLLFCSDHGRIRGFSKTPPQLSCYDNGGHHIPYIICDRKTHSGTDIRLVSHLDTIDILINFVNDKPAFDDIKHRTLAEFNQEFLYSEKLLDKFIDIEAHRACKCFISDEDKYIVFYDGEEQYFLLPDDDTNLIDDERYTDRINWFRENVNTEFPDWNDDNGRYDIARKYYDIDKKKVSK